jgi:hypothetical protein
VLLLRGHQQDQREVAGDLVGAEAATEVHAASRELGVNHHKRGVGGLVEGLLEGVNVDQAAEGRREGVEQLDVELPPPATRMVGSCATTRW